MLDTLELVVRILGGLGMLIVIIVVLVALGLPIFLRRARLEEQAHSNTFDAKYIDYRERVPAFFPLLFGLNSNHRSEKEDLP